MLLLLFLLVVSAPLLFCSSGRVHFLLPLTLTGLWSKGLCLELSSTPWLKVLMSLLTAFRPGGSGVNFGGELGGTALKGPLLPYWRP